ncbi:MAG: class I SAM-dependent methyltransferase [Candidatus Dormibacteria bacterium]
MNSNGEKDWFRDAEFWEEFAPVIFDVERVGGAAGEVDQVLALTGVRAGAALDLCCGRGRHSLELARRGFEVTGVDITPGYVQRAKVESSDEGLAGIEFVLADVRDFERPGAFDLAISLYTSFGYFKDLTDDRRVLTHAYNALRPGGALLVETLGKESAAMRLRRRHWFRPPGSPDDICFVENRVAGAWERLHLDWTLVRADGTRRSAILDIRLFSAVEMASLLQDAGFTRVEVYGDLAGNPYNETATILVAVARKL